jgi:hypothetical protein
MTPPPTPCGYAATKLCNALLGTTKKAGRNARPARLFSYLSLFTFFYRKPKTENRKPSIALLHGLELGLHFAQEGIERAGLDFPGEP